MYFRRNTRERLLAGIFSHLFGFHEIASPRIEKMQGDQEELHLDVFFNEGREPNQWVLSKDANESMNRIMTTFFRFRKFQ